MIRNNNRKKSKTNKYNFTTIAMVYFENDFLTFFKELAANNNKDWFDLNRKRYTKIIKEPFKSFISDVIYEINKIDSSISIEPKDAIFRINRDIRFSKDKTPYKLYLGAVISPIGKKDRINPGIYIELGPEHLSIFGGVWKPDTAQRDKIRNYISYNLEDFNKIISDTDFTHKFPGGIKGEKSKRIPKELNEVSKIQNLIYNKQFYYQAFLNPEEIIKENLMNTILDYYKETIAINDFLKKAMSIE